MIFRLACLLAVVDALEDAEAMLQMGKLGDVAEKMAIGKSKSADAAGNGSSRNCLRHYHCSSSTYCDTWEKCYLCSGCATYKDAIDGICPAKCGAAGNNGSSGGNGYMTTAASPGNNGSSAGNNGSSGGNGYVTTAASAGNNGSSGGNGYMTTTAASAANSGSSAGNNGFSAGNGITPSELIPKRLIYTGPIDPEDIMQRNRQWLEPNTQFRYYNDSQMAASARMISEKLSEELGVDGAFEAFLSLRPMAFRADLWRYMILWDIGGLYLDNKLALVSPVASWLNRSRNTVYTCTDETVSDPTGPVYWNAVIAARPRHPGLLQVIRDTISNIANRRYRCEGCPEGYMDLYVTGPGSFSRGLRRADANVTSIGALRHAWNSNLLADSIVNISGQPVIVVDERVHKETHGGSYSYTSLWGQHAVFCDEPAVPHVQDPCETPNIALYQMSQVSRSDIESKGFWSKIISPAKLTGITTPLPAVAELTGLRTPEEEAIQKHSKYWKDVHTAAELKP